MLLVLHFCITYNVSSVRNGELCYFPGLLNFIQSVEQKNRNIVIKHPILNYGMCLHLEIYIKNTKVFITEILEDTPLHI